MLPKGIQSGKRYVVKTPCPLEVVTTIRRAGPLRGWLCRDESGYELIVLVAEFTGLTEDTSDCAPRRLAS